MNKRTILIIDTSLQTIESLSALFEDTYNVIHAENVLKGYNLAIEHQPDLILLEIMMPIMDGFKVCTEFKQNANTIKIPIVFISSLNSRDEIMTGLYAGAIDFVHKPIDEEYLKIKINNYFSHREALSESALSL